VLELVEVARAVGKGDLARTARHYMDDENGELSDVFNAMTRELARSRDELVRHNRELAALNAVIVTVSNFRSLIEGLVGCSGENPGDRWCVDGLDCSPPF
jgi:nitrogen fixation/metabolism regulation signal transduction histidine kinase